MYREQMRTNKGREYQGEGNDDSEDESRASHSDDLGTPLTV